MNDVQRCLQGTTEKLTMLFVSGTRLQVPHLWAYFLLDQILPVSFTQNLFRLATILHVQPSQDRNWKPAGSKAQTMIPLAYLASLTTSTFQVDTPWSLPILFIG
jgi:hypothetical protein